MLLRGQSENLLLSALPAEDFELLRRDLRVAMLPGQTVLFDAGDTIGRAYFPHNSAITLGVVLSGDHMIETALVGREGVAGADGLFAGEPAFCRAVVQIAGSASTVEAEPLRELMQTRPSVQSLLWRHGRALFAQTQRSAACNAAHSLEARLCRWLLRASDACGDMTLSTTQELIAEILGVRRTSISLIAHKMQEAGLIRTRRGHIELLDLSALRKSSCECYASTALQYEHLLSPDEAKITGTA